jgi:hypothetical protein
MSGKHAARMTVHVCDRSQSSPKPPSFTHYRTVASMSSCGSPTSDAQGIVCEVIDGLRHVAKLSSIVECVVVEHELIRTLSHIRLPQDVIGSRLEMILFALTRLYNGQ